MWCPDIFGFNFHIIFNFIIFIFSCILFLYYYINLDIILLLFVFIYHLFIICLFVCDIHKMIISDDYLLCLCDDWQIIIMVVISGDHLLSQFIFLSHLGRSYNEEKLRHSILKKYKYKLILPLSFSSPVWFSFSFI